MVGQSVSAFGEDAWGRVAASDGDRSRHLTLRTLHDIGELGAPEAELLAGLDSGGYHQCGDGSLPTVGDMGRAIRASLLRLLLLGAPDVPRLHEKGLRLRGAWVIGSLDLEGCQDLRGITLADCRFDSPLILRSAGIDSLLLDGSVLPGLAAERLRAKGGVHLRAAEIDGAINLRGAQLDGDLVLDGSAVTQIGGIAFDAAHIVTRGDLTLRGSRLRGSVRVVGAQLTGDLSLIGTSLGAAEGIALAADGVKVAGDVDLRAATIAGEASFIGSRVRGDVKLEGGTFEAPGGIALTLNRAVIEGALFLRHGTKMAGALSLNGTQVGTIVDEPESWPKAGDLLLNRFRYGGFVGGPVDARTRLDWLSRQSPARWGEDFWPQPYEQLSTVLDQMGHRDDARRILFEKERLQRRMRRIRAGRPWRTILLLKDALLLLTVGYGLHPLLAFVWIALFWLAGVGLLAAVQAEGQLRPNSAVFLRSPEWVLCGAPSTQELYLPSSDQRRRGLAVPGQSQVGCFLQQPEVRSFPKFNKWVYSLEAVLPGLEAGQRAYWSPDTRSGLGYTAKRFEYVQRIAGLALGVLALAGFSGLVRLK
jgi:hypothetical protein